MRQPKINKDRGELNIRQAADLMRSLSNPNRLLVACALLEGEKSVPELEGALGMKQSMLSQRLADLRAAGVLRARCSSKLVLYSVADAKAEHLIVSLQRIFCENAAFGATRPEIPAGMKATLQAAVCAQAGRRTADR